MVQIFSMFRSMILAAYIVFTGSLMVSDHAWSSEDVQLAERRERCVNILRKAMKSEGNFWMNVHAAEALLWNIYPEGVEEHFSSLENTPGANIVGISRVKARANLKNAVEYQKHVNRIRDVFLDTDSPNRAGALESLGKLKYSERLPEIIRLASEGGSDIRGFARWVLANSGDEHDEAYLADLLNSDEPRDYFYTAYALRFFDIISPETYALLEACAVRLPESADHRVYVLSARFVHAPPEKRTAAKNELITYINGEKNERYEICEALSICGDESDIPLLEQLLDDPDMDVRVSAANALLRIERRDFRGLRWLDWGIIVLYALAMLGIGWYFSRRQKTSEEYLVGKRQVNSYVAGISLYASFLSTISYLAIAGEIIKHGPLIAIIHFFCFPIIYGITGYFLIPFFMKLPITSAYEIIEKPLTSAGIVSFLMNITGVTGNYSQN